MRRRLRNMVVVVGAVGVLAMVSPGEAVADSSQCSVPSGTCAARVTFQSYGEVFKIYDQVGDGHSAVLLYW
ncbi:MAG TPA: hypothetical protein VFM55_14145, partial [Micromonosporaceae bacterium]|nr:hypothetical protein [Micromonosporaceae bacterium]